MRKLLTMAAVLALTACEGPAGPQGPEGETGVPGADGIPGEKGDQGPKGADGQKGEGGPQGKDGPQGIPGDPGTPGDPAEPADPPTGRTGAGLDVQIRNVTVDGRQVTIDVVAVDAFGTAIDDRVETLSLRFTLAEATRDGDAPGAYRTLITREEVAGEVRALQPATDSRGMLTRKAAGSYSYRFNAQLPEDHDPAATFVVAGWGERTALDGERYVDNFVKPFVPAGGAPAPLREVVTTATCNGCHLDLEAHGGSRREVALCTTCHAVGFSDAQSGNDIGFPVMIHKIHRGEDLPSVKAGEPYRIFGYNASEHDYSDVVFPQDVRNCETCHAAGAAQADRWKTDPGAPACLSCHDRIWMKGGTPPAGFTAHLYGITESVDCSVCHGPESMYPVATVHLTPDRDPANPSLRLTLRSAEGIAPGGTPTIRFTARDAAGNALDLDALPAGVTVSRIAVTVGGPTTAYANVFSYTMKGGGAVGTLTADATPGDYTWVGAAALPAGLEGTYGVALEGRLAKGGVNFPSPNPVQYVAVTDATAVRPDAVVSLDQCNACHKDLSLHGGLRHNVEYCVMCHNPTGTDAARRPADQLPAQTIDLRVLAHAIHGASVRENPYVVYGFGGSRHDFSEVRFPAEPSRCDACHVSLASTGLKEDQPFNVIRSAGGEVVKATPAGAAVCSSCHDSEGALTHMELNTIGLGLEAREACTVCHDADAEFAPSHAHGLE